MKSIRIFLLLVPVFAVLGGCQKFVEGFETSPNDPTEVTPALQMSSAQLGTFASFVGQLARVSNVLTQGCAGTDFQLVNVATYDIQEGDNDNEWESLYADCLIDLESLIGNAEVNPRYAGIAQVLKALNLGLLTDIWGDVPNSQALQGLQGVDFFNPAFDAQEDVYRDIQQLLSDAVINLGSADEDNLETPGADDFIHGGDAAAWIVTAHMLRARYAIHLTKRNEADAVSNALSALDDAVNAGMVGADNDANAKFGTAGAELNPWNAFINNRGGYIKAGEALVDLMNTINDPRVPFYFTTDTGGIYRGTPLGSIDQSTSDVGPYFATDNASAPLVTYAEAKFIEAEARFRDGDAAGAAQAHNAAIIAHITLVTGAAPDAAYVTDQASETASTISLEKIMTHKWVAMFTQVETWTDWRRTGIPALSPDPRGVVSGIPRRFPTPLSERNTNSNAVVVSDILTPVWWDE